MEPPFPQTNLKLPLIDGTTNKTSIQELLLLLGIQTIWEPGILPIKQMELYKKLRENVPVDYHDEMCPKPSDDVLKKFSAEQKTKKKDKRAAKKKRTEPPLPADGDNDDVNNKVNIQQQL